MQPAGAVDAYPERAGLREATPHLARVPTALSNFLALMSDKNLLLRAAGHAELIAEDVIGGRLYTGNRSRY